MSCKATGPFLFLLVLSTVTDRRAGTVPDMSSVLIGKFGITHLDSFFSQFVSVDEIIIDDGNCVGGFKKGLLNPVKKYGFLEHRGFGWSVGTDEISETGFGLLKIGSLDHIMGISNLLIFSFLIPFFYQ